MFVSSPSFGTTILRHQDVSQIGFAFAAFGIETKRAFIMLERLVEVSEVSPRQAKAKLGLGQRWIASVNGDRLARSSADLSEYDLPRGRRTAFG